MVVFSESRRLKAWLERGPGGIKMPSLPSAPVRRRHWRSRHWLVKWHDCIPDDLKLFHFVACRLMVTPQLMT